MDIRADVLMEAMKRVVKDKGDPGLALILHLVNHLDDVGREMKKEGDESTKEQWNSFRKSLKELSVKMYRKTPDYEKAYEEFLKNPN